MATIKGIWVLNENPAGEDFGSHNVNFTSNSKTFTSISYGANPDYMDGAALVYANDSETVYAYDFEYTSAWSNEAYKTVDFGSTEQTVDDTFYTWLTANATQQATEETSGVTVEYNGSVVATIPNGYKATLPIADKEMKTDIVITVPEAESGGDSGIDSALPIEVSTAADMDALLELGDVGGIYKYVGESTEVYERNALYILEEAGFALTVNSVSAEYMSDDVVAYFKINGEASTEDFDYKFEGYERSYNFRNNNAEDQTLPLVMQDVKTLGVYLDYGMLDIVTTEGTIIGSFDSWDDSTKSGVVELTADITVNFLHSFCD